MNDTTKVVSFRGDPCPQARVRQDALVAYLRGLVERAESGDLQGVGAVCLDADGGASWRVIGLAGSYSMVGAAYCVLDDLKKTSLGETT